MVASGTGDSWNGLRPMSYVVLPGISEGELACATQQCHRYPLGGNLEGGAELSVSCVLLE